MNKLGKSFGERRSVHPLLGEREREREREKEFSRRQDLEALSMTQKNFKKKFSVSKKI